MAKYSYISETNFFHTNFLCNFFCLNFAIHFNITFRIFLNLCEIKKETFATNAETQQATAPQFW